ncbi:uncharacterized protein HD556DRAFT_1404236 [Suillus plorans]|uniref:Pinin/SDK/MemA protein domain-containing protein n=1 Tax=Suillus plorans TaxID=116603 RepID=A0A9P7DDH1_9AGAM|nr:uncharacterized protein HD556DRAFT_1404236 [Suillus plorans]KAG1788377.1 hypothetical protein HD556DRAFT_1404236 [Suillus plorans]
MSTKLKPATDAKLDTDTRDQMDAEQEPDSQPARKRPRIDLGVGERKRGKSMFGIVLGTLNKAKIEDKERNASEAAKKRQMIDQRLQAKLRKETDSVRRSEEAKKDRNLANRKEEELQLKDSIYKLRRTHLPLYSHFLCTSDDTQSIDSMEDQPSSITLLALPTRSHPPPLFYLPAILTAAQEAFLEKRKFKVKEAAESEWSTFRGERTAGIDEIKELRLRVADEDARKKKEKKDEIEADEKNQINKDEEMTSEEPKTSESKTEERDSKTEAKSEERESKTEEMEVDVGTKEESGMRADDEDAVEY